MRAINRMQTDLDQWLEGLNVPENNILAIYQAIRRENGVAAHLLNMTIANVFPLSTTVKVEPHEPKEELRRLRSGEFAQWLMSQPEPEPEEMRKLLAEIDDVLPNLRKHFSDAAVHGPQHRHGRRPKEFDDPEICKEICAKIKARRGPGTKLDDIFKSVATEYISRHSEHRKPVSPMTIKRVWLECGRNEE